MVPVDISDFASSQLQLLDRELQVELAETTALASQASHSQLQQAGLAILNLTVASQKTGLGGKTVLDLELDPAVGSGELPSHGLRVGDIVGIKEQIKGAAKKREKSEADRQGVDGVVVKTTPSIIAVVLDSEDAEVPNGKLWIIKLASDVTYKRMNQTMTKLEKSTEAEQSSLMRVLFGQIEPTPQSEDPQLDTIKWKSERLNQSQKDAIVFSLRAREIALIHGPPGTGKTHTLVELILQLVQQGKHLLVCGPSNISVDNIVERLSAFKVPLVRLGHPARLLPSVLNHSLEFLTKTSDAAGLVKDIRKEMDDKQGSIRKTRNGRERKVIYGELKELRKEFRERERNCIESIVQGSKVVLATTHGAGDFHLKHAKFDVVIIDEASQALEASCWIPLLSAKKAVLAGDHLQLPPTIKSLNSRITKSSSTKQADTKQPDGREKVTPKKASVTLETTLFDRLLKLYGPSIKKMLTVQYRMHENIMQFPSDELYDSRLEAAPDVQHHLLKDLDGIEETEDTIEPLVFYDTQGGNFPEKAEDAEDSIKAAKGLGESKSNEMEASVATMHVRKLVEAGVEAADIAVITPYVAQVAIISKSLRTALPAVEVGSVDGFQGREKEAVVVSLVRSNDDHEVGFLNEKRRLNVAMTRPRRHLAIIGDSETIGRGSTFLKRWMDHLEQHADLRFPDPSQLG